MFKTVLQGVVSLGFCLGSTSYASDEKVEKEYHCEKTVDGKTVDLNEVKDRKSCKKKGGLWKKGSHEDHKDHKDHDDHKEHEH